MELEDIYSPQELTEKRIQFLERTLEIWDDPRYAGTKKLGAQVGHKLRGTGGTLGFGDLCETGTELQNLINKGTDVAVIAGMLEKIKPSLSELIEKQKKLLDVA